MAEMTKIQEWDKCFKITPRCPALQNGNLLVNTHLFLVFIHSVRSDCVTIDSK